MLDLKTFSSAIQQIADEKGIPRDKIIETIELALAAAYKRDYGKKGQIVRAKMDPATGKLTMRQIKIVVDESMIKSEEEVLAEEEERARRLAGLPPEEKKRKEEREEEMEEPGEKRVRYSPEKHIMLEEARAIKPDAELKDELEFPLESHDDFGRIAAQTAKQVIIQRIREIERETIFDEFKSREGELVSGLIQRIEGRNVYVDIGRTVALLPAEEQIPYERYSIGSRVKGLILGVEKNPKGPGIFISRSHPLLLRKLFELEAPEIPAGTVEIKAIAREPGSRSKVAVISHEAGVDPVGSLVGQKGIRVSTVISELGGEKIDIIEWSDNPTEFIGNSLSPAKVLSVEIMEARREARAIVAEDQLSLAIGKGGQNVRLAAKLTGWRIDVRAAQAPAEKTEEGVIEQENSTPAESTETTEVTPAPEEAPAPLSEAPATLSETPTKTPAKRSKKTKPAEEDK